MFILNFESIFFLFFTFFYLFFFFSSTVLLFFCSMLVKCTNRPTWGFRNRDVWRSASTFLTIFLRSFILIWRWCFFLIFRRSFLKFCLLIFNNTTFLSIFSKIPLSEKLLHFFKSLDFCSLRFRHYNFY